MKRITELPVSPEEYKNEILDSLNPMFHEHAMMGMDERYFLNGLLAYYEPRNVLELGVNFGEGSAEILHSIRSTPGAKLTSIDIAENAIFTKIINQETGEKQEFISTEPIGNFALTHPDLPLDCWNLITGKDPSEVIADLDASQEGYDFMVLDTAHYHPIELLNFICALPFLKDGAIVVLHDINLFQLFFPPKAFACRNLFQSVCADRIKINRKFPNIGAFLIREDTRNYISNVFEALFYPWEIDPRSVRMPAILDLVRKHHTKENQELMAQAYERNLYYVCSGKKEWYCSIYNNYIEFLIMQLSDHTVFYGAGHVMSVCLEYCHDKGIAFDCPIWDIRADEIKDLFGYRVTKPDFTSSGSGKNLVIAIDDTAIREEVRAQFERLGYNVTMYLY